MELFERDGEEQQDSEVPIYGSRGLTEPCGQHGVRRPRNSSSADIYPEPDGSFGIRHVLAITHTQETF